MPTNIPSFGPDGLTALRQDPLAALQQACQQYDSVVRFADRSAVFSGLTDCSGTFGVFGAARVEQVLTNGAAFHRPASLAERLGLPFPVTNLSSGIFSMNGDRHRRHRRLLGPLLSAAAVQFHHSAVLAGCDAFLTAQTPDATVEILSVMRRLSLEIWSRVVFGTPPRGPEDLGGLMQRLLLLRRMHTVFPEGPARREVQAALVDTGIRLDGALRGRIQELRNHGADRPACVLAQMAVLEQDGRPALADDELVAHTHGIYLAASEPVAVALTWALIALSQLPTLRAKLARRLAPDGAPGGDQLLNQVLLETLRVLPPSAIVLRITDREILVADQRIPARAEVLLSPYVAQREPAVFPRPDVFDPSRWRAAQPTRFQFFPFGAGDRSCLGRFLAMLALRTALGAILQRHSPVLAGDQVIDWQVAVTLMPATDVYMTLGRAGAPGVGGRVQGPLRQLIKFD